MDYKKCRIVDLQKMLDEKGIKYRSIARKKELVNLLEQQEEKVAEKETKIEKLINHRSEKTDKQVKVKNFTKDDLKKLDRITRDMVRIARGNNNIVDDVSISLEISKCFGTGYPKEMFIHIEKQLELKNVTINFTNDKIIESLLPFRDVELEAGSEEIDYNIESILKNNTRYHNFDEIRNFLSTINDYPLLTPEKEHEICATIDKYSKKLASGKKLTFKENEKYEEAREILILSNKRLVISIAKRHINRGLDLIDLLMEGMLGLEKAIQKFDINTGYKFSTYATWWIRQGITRGLADKSKVIRVPVHMVETINKVAKAQRELTQQLGQEPTTEQIGKAVKPTMSAEQVEHIFEISRDPVLLEMPVGEDNSVLEAFVEDNKNINQEEEIEEKELKLILISLIYELPIQEGDVLLYRYGLYDFNFDSFNRLIKMSKYLLEGLKNDTIDCKDIETIVQLTNQLNKAQKELLLKRIKQNNAKYSIIIKNLEKYKTQDQNNPTTKHATKVAEKQIENIKEKNIAYIKHIIESTEDRIQHLKKIKEITGGVVKPLTLEQVGSIFHVTRERIRQIENKGKRKLRSYAKQKDLEFFVK